MDTIHLSRFLVLCRTLNYTEAANASFMANYIQNLLAVLCVRRPPSHRRARPAGVSAAVAAGTVRPAAPEL